MPPSEQPILFLWSLSPWASKITAYLALRRIPYSRSEQPITQPRPTLAALGLNYRRIPVLALGRDIYCDTLLILEKLESLYPPSAAHPAISGGGTNYTLERLLEKWTDTVVFGASAKVIPSSLELMQDPGFQKDREELWGRPWTAKAQDALRPKGLADLRANFAFLEELLGDGREWITGNDGPMLADVHCKASSVCSNVEKSLIYADATPWHQAAWILDWLQQIDAYDAKFFSAETHPKTFAWINRYSAALASAKESAPQPTELSGPDAVARVLGAGFQEDDKELTVEEDPEGFEAGDEVEMWPVDTGFDRKDGGKLVKLRVNEAVVAKRSLQEGKEVRVHYPRWNFAMKKAVPTDSEEKEEDK